MFHRDIPTVRDALALPLQVALLKGRANYVCHYHLERNLREGMLPSRQEVSHLHQIARFAKTTNTGDKAELSAVPEDASAWMHATSTRDNCLGQSCPNFNDCFLMKARRAALESDVVVVNHHLFFADVMLRDEGMAELPIHHVWVGDWQRGIRAERNMVVLSMPSRLDPSLAPPGHQVLHGYTPANEPWELWKDLERGTPAYEELRLERCGVFHGVFDQLVPDWRERVVLELLGPNFRPVQVTDDLPGFWERLYPEVKKELKRRYPRHEWR